MDKATALPRGRAVDSILYFDFPSGAVFTVLDDDAFFEQLVTDAVGLRPVFVGFCRGTRRDLVVDPVLGDAFFFKKLELLCRFFRLCLCRLFDLGVSRLDQSEGEDAVEVGDQPALGRVVELALEHIIERGDGKGGVQVVVERRLEFLLIRLCGVEIGLAVLAELCDLRDQLVVCLHGVVEILKGEYQRLAVVGLQAEEAVGKGIIALFFEQRNGQKAALTFAHLAALVEQVQDMEPVGAPLMAEVGLTLRDLVGVVGEGVVDTAAVDVEVFACVLDRDRGALDVPSGIAQSPRGFPLQRLILKLALGEPEDKVVFVALVAVLVDVVTHADLQFVLIHVAENIVVVELTGIEIDIAARKVGIALIDQGLYHLDELGDAVGGGLDDVGLFDVELFGVGEERVGVELRDIHDALVLTLSAREHFILAGVRVGAEVSHVGDIHHAQYVISRVAQVFFEHILHDVGAQVADMGVVVDGGTAGVHLHLALFMRDEFLSGAAESIVQNHDGLPFCDESL